MPTVYRRGQLLLLIHFLVQDKTAQGSLRGAGRLISRHQYRIERQTSGASTKQFHDAIPIRAAPVSLVYFLSQFIIGVIQ